MVANYLLPVGIRVAVQPLERAAFLRANQEKRLRTLRERGVRERGNTARRVRRLGRRLRVRKLTDIKGRASANRRRHLTTAMTMYREMGLTYWLEQAERTSASA